MSKLIIISLYDVANPTEAVSIIRSVGKEYGVGVQFNVPDNEPFLKEYAWPDLLFTISDNEKTENCEYLLLPDGWIFNDVKNPIPFAQRMKILQHFAYRLNSVCRKLEILVGESGMDLDNFVIYEVNVKNIPNIMVDRYCGTYDCNAIRLLVCK